MIRTLQIKQQSAGKYSVEWNGQNEAGLPVNSGIYFYQLQTDDYVETKKMFLLN
jgi:flagellar hook assembly protein FlgD